MDKFSTKSSSSEAIHGVIWEDHVQSVFQRDRLLLLKETRALTDVILEAKFPDGTKKQIPAHKLIISLASQYFWDQFVDSNSYLSSSSTTSSPIHLRVSGIDPLALETIINFIYSGQLMLTENLVEKLYIAAELLQISVVQTKCTDYMIANINEETCGHRLEFARGQNCNELFSAVVNYINHNYTEFLNSPDFLRLHFKEVVVVLNTPRRLETPEETIFMSILNWLNHDDAGRIKYSAPLLKELDLRHLAEDFLQFHFETQKVLRGYESRLIYKNFLDSCSMRKKVDEDINNQISCNNDTIPVSNISMEDEMYCVPPRISPQLPQRKNHHDKNSDDIDGSQKKKRKIESISNDTKIVESFASTSSGPINIKPTARKRTGNPPPPKQHHVHHHQIVQETIKSDLRIIPTSSQNESFSKSKISPKNINQNSIDNNNNSGRQQINTNKLNGHDSRTLDPKSVHVPSEITIKYSSRYPSQQTELMKNSKNSICSNSSNTESREKLGKSYGQVILYLKEGKEEGRIMMHDLTPSSNPRRLRNFYKNNKSCTLLWVNKLRRLYALGGVKSLYEEQSSTTDVRFTSEENLKQPQCKKKTWSVGPPMIQERTNFVAVVLNNYIYAMGGAEGSLGNIAVNCAERLSLESKNAKWEDTDYLQRSRHGFGAAVLDGKIYVAGGYGAMDDEADCTMGILNTVECYDPKTDEWSFIASMHNERHGLCLVTYNGVLFAIGGGGMKSHVSFEEDIPNMKSVEVYDKHKNKWDFVASMNCPRKNGSAVVLNGKLYAIAGDHSKGEQEIIESSVEVYDPIQDKWTKVLNTIDNLGKFESVTVWDSPNI